MDQDFAIVPEIVCCTAHSTDWGGPGRLGRPLELRNKRINSPLADYFAFFALRSAHQVEVAAHGYAPSTANQTSVARPGPSRFTVLNLALPHCRNRFRASRSWLEVWWRPNRSLISARDLPAVPAPRSAVKIVSATGLPRLSPKICLALSSENSHTAVAALRCGSAIVFELSRTA